MPPKFSAPEIRTRRVHQQPADEQVFSSRILPVSSFFAPNRLYRREEFSLEIASKLGAIHHHATAASFASANDFAFLLHRDRSAHWTSNFTFVIDRLSRFRRSFR